MAARPCVALGARYRGLPALQELALRLREEGFRPTVEQRVARRLGKATCVKSGLTVREPSARPRPVLAVALGGDGSFIKMASLYAVKDVPMVGINLGRVGFLADINSRTMSETVLDVLSGKFRDETRNILEVRHRRGGSLVSRQIVINDVVIDRGDVGTLIDLEVSVDGEHAFQLRGDGMIVSTPGGSTAYNLAAGGPIVTPDSSCTVLTPLNPYSLTHRPIVFNTECRFTIKVVSRSRLVPDGQVTQELEAGDLIDVRTHAKQMTVRHPQSYDYFDTLREKLYWRHD